MADIYRKSSLEKLSSPEQLDKMIKITSPSLWIAYIGILAVMVVVVVWAVFGKLPENLDASGVFVNTSSNGFIFTEGNGKVKKINVSTGDTVKKGDMIVELENPSVDIQIEQIEKRLLNVRAVTLDSTNDVSTSDTASLLEIKMNMATQDSNYKSVASKCKEYERLSQKQRKKVRSLKASMEAAGRKYVEALENNDYNKVNYDYQKAQSEYSSAITEYKECSQVVAQYNSLSKEQLSALQKEYKAAVAAQKKALKTYKARKKDFDKAEKTYREKYVKQSVVSAKETSLSNEYSKASSLYNSAYSTMLSLESQVTELKLSEKVAEQEKDKAVKKLEKQFKVAKASAIDALNKQIQELKYQNSYTQIKASCDGDITGISVINGQEVTQGTQVAKIKQKESSDKEVLCYVSLISVKQIKEGMKVIVTPSNVNEQEYGHMTGTVLSVADYCADTNEMIARLGDELLVSTFQQSGPVVEVAVKLDEDSSTASGYAWSNKKGAAIDISENTFMSLKIVTDEKAPISKLIPMMKEMLMGEKETTEEAQ